MNNYIDERFIPYNRKTGARRTVRTKKAVKKQNKGILGVMLVESLRFLAAIFLLIVSTFGREEGGRSEINAEKVIKWCLCYGGVAFALWAIAVVLSNVVNAVTLLPTWTLIFIFAATLLAAAGVLKR